MIAASHVTTTVKAHQEPSAIGVNRFVTSAPAYIGCRTTAYGPPQNHRTRPSRIHRLPNTEINHAQKPRVLSQNRNSSTQKGLRPKTGHENQKPHKPPPTNAHPQGHETPQHANGISPPRNAHHYNGR